MKKFARFAIAIGFFLVFASMGLHKFYVSIYQVNFAPEKKMLQITTRIFADDLNNALEKKYKRKFHLGAREEIPEDVVQMQKYMADNFSLKVSGKPKPMQFMSKEMESNVLVCYFRIADISKVSRLEITNKILFDYVTEQQNIIQTTVNGKKTSLLLTIDEPQGTIDF